MPARRRGVRVVDGRARPYGSPAPSTPGRTTGRGGSPACRWPGLRGACAARTRASSSCRRRGLRARRRAAAAVPPVDVDAYLGPDLVEELALLDFADWRPTATPTSTRSGRTGRSRSTRTARTTTSTTCTRTRRRPTAYGGVLLTFDAFGPHPRTARRCGRSTSSRHARGRWGDVDRSSATSTPLFPNTSLTVDNRTSSCGRSSRSRAGRG